MKNYWHKINRYSIYLSLVAGLCLAFPVNAQNVELSWQRDKAADSKDKTGEFAMDELAVKANLLTYQDSQESMKAGLNFKRTSMDWSASNALDDTYVWLGVPINYTQKRSSNTELVAFLEPGVMASRDELNQKAIFANAALSARVYMGNNAFWQLGALVDRKFGDARVYPLAAIAWKPDAITEVQLGFPYSQVHARWSDSFSTYAKVQPNGGLWRVGTTAVTENPPTEQNPDEEPAPPEEDEDANEEPTDEPNEPQDQIPTSTSSASKKLKYQSWQLAIGTNVHWRDGFWLNAEAGYQFDRHLQQAGVNFRAEDAIYWKLGLKVEF